MGELHVHAEKVVNASAETVYKFLADYTTNHPKILPASFSNLKVLEGGTGEGTVVSFSMTAGGRTRNYQMKVTEPEPGVLKETDANSTLVTTYTVTPQSAGALVQIDTRWQGAKGFKGLMERTFAPGALKGLYAEILGKLESCVRS